jgi:hypothetical protein
MRLLGRFPRASASKRGPVAAALGTVTDETDRTDRHFKTPVRPAESGRGCERRPDRMP